MTEYYVNDNTELLYTLEEGTTERYGVLFVKAIGGSVKRCGDTMYRSQCGKLREATLKDFEYFRVCSAGHTNK